MKWLIHLENAPKRVNHAACTFKNKYIFTFGGYSEELVKENLQNWTPIDIHCLNISTLKWHKIKYEREIEPNNIDEDIPFFRYGHTCVEYNDKIYLWGGRADWLLGILCNNLHEYDPILNKWSLINPNGGNKPLGRDGHSTCVYKTGMFIFGGFIEQIRQFSNDLHEFNFISNEWSLIKPKSELKPNHRDFHTSTCLNDKIYIFGGRMDTGGIEFTGNNFYCNKIYEYDLLKNEWNEINGNRSSNTKNYLPLGRRSHVSIAYKNKLIFFGGYNENLKRHFNDLFEFNIITKEWNLIKANGDYPSERRRACACLINDRVYLFGGTGPIKSDKEHALNKSLSLEQDQQQDQQEVNNNTEDSSSSSSDNDDNHNMIFQDGYLDFEQDDEEEDDDDDDDSDWDSDDDYDDDDDSYHKDLYTKNDLYVLSLEIPKLRDLCLVKISKQEFDYNINSLPIILQNDVNNLILT